MADFSLADLISGRSAQQIYNDALAYIANPPDPNLVSVSTANWRTGGPYKTLLARQGIEGELVYQLISAFAGSAFLRYASGRWLDWLGKYFFGEDRQAAQFATATLTITVPTGDGPYGPIQIVAQTADGKVFSSINQETIPAGPGVYPFSFRAAKAGSVFNVGPNTITQLVSPNVLGLTITNAAKADGGYDEEPDDRYRQRLAVKWGALSTGSTAAAYIFWAMTASQEVQKVRAYSNLNDLGVFEDKAVTVILAGTAASVSPAAVAAVLAYITPRIPLDAKLYVIACRVLTLNVTGTVKVFTPYLSVAAAKIANSLQDLGKAVPIGSYDAGPVPLAEFADAIIYDRREIYDVTPTNPTGPTALAYDQILVPTNGLTLSGVP